MNEQEKTGDKFTLKTYLESRKTCIAVFEEIVKQIKPGHTEDSIKKLLIQTFNDYGISKFWHPSKIRISTDTLKNFRENSDPDLSCRSGDICFLDVGPIIGEYEADYGRTFIIEEEHGLSPSPQRKMIDACHQIFKQTAQQWKENKLTGVELYHFADQTAKQYDLELNPLMAGHRLGDFPHKLYSSQKLSDFEHAPTQNLWVLEIHVVDKKQQRGAFFEDLLM